jgi:hypothetical protein
MVKSDAGRLHFHVMPIPTARILNVVRFLVSPVEFVFRRIEHRFGIDFSIEWQRRERKGNRVRMVYLETFLLILLFAGFGCSALVTSDQTESQRNLATQSMPTKTLSENRDRKNSHEGDGLSAERTPAGASIPSQTEICNSDELLLSIYEFRELYGTPLPKVCCTDVIKLKAQWRCDVDWPSSDVPTCASLSDMADRLTRFIDARPKWYTAEHTYRALANAGRLRSLSASKGECIP